MKQELTLRDTLVIERLLEEGEKIKAITRYREATGAGLSEAKEAIDKIQRKSNNE